MKRILDVCCGPKLFWFNRKNPDVVFMDKRSGQIELSDGREVSISPDIVGDFRALPYPDETFSLVVFDPPHLLRAGKNSWLAAKYGILEKTWRKDIRQGFAECMRVLKPDGILIFKWSEDQISTADVLKVIPEEPLFGNRRGKAIFFVFMKGGNHDNKA